MGGCFSSDNEDNGGVQYKRPVWTSEQPVTRQRVQRMRDEFWDTQPHYGGDKNIWDALKAACAAEDQETTKLIIDAAGIIVAARDMTVCYDERGAKYELPVYVLSDPVNLVLDDETPQPAQQASPVA